MSVKKPIVLDLCRCSLPSRSPPPFPSIPRRIHTFESQVLLLHDQVVVKVVHHAVRTNLAVEGAQARRGIDGDQLEDVVGLLQNLRRDAFLVLCCKWSSVFGRCC